MGAWIETTTEGVNLLSRSSHPVWVRGLKQVYQVATTYRQKSHPVWVRGLKQNRGAGALMAPASHPVWVRGLKHDKYKQTRDFIKVAPRVGAWIETWEKVRLFWEANVAPRVGAWIETSLRRMPCIQRVSRTPCGCVD